MVLPVFCVRSSASDLAHQAALYEDPGLSDGGNAGVWKGSLRCARRLALVSNATLHS